LQSCCNVKKRKKKDTLLFAEKQRQLQQKRERTGEQGIQRSKQESKVLRFIHHQYSTQGLPQFVEAQFIDDGSWSLHLLETHLNALCRLRSPYEAMIAKRAREDAVQAQSFCKVCFKICSGSAVLCEECMSHKKSSKKPGKKRRKTEQ
jgi:hypothetical protein